MNLVLCKSPSMHVSSWVGPEQAQFCEEVRVPTSRIVTEISCGLCVCVGEG